MIQAQPDLIDSFDYLGETIRVEWFDVADTSDFPDVAWQQVYAVTNCSGKVGLVYDLTGKSNLPGGKTEEGETIEQTLRRELLEEMNCRVLDWRPIGYQRLTGPNGDTAYQARVYATIEQVGEFVADSGGGVVGQRYIELAQLNDEIQYGKVGERIMRMVAKEF